MSRHISGLYQKSERQKIIDHIIEKNIYFELRGRAVWQEMEKLQICPGRSWQSMKHHFHTNIIQILDSVNISEAEKNRILDCFYKRYLHSPIKRKREPSTSSPEAEKQDSTNKKIKIPTSDVEDEKSPELIKECSRNITTTEEIRPNNLSSMDDDYKNDLDSSLLEPYGEQEDRNIIIYIKEHMNWNDLEYFDDIYENCHKQLLLKRSGTSIKKRFLNVILPNVYKYNILEVDEIPLFYDRAGIDIPPELDQILTQLMENSSNYSGEIKDESILINNIEENKTQENEEDTNTENKFSVNNHKDQNTSFNNMLQNQNMFLNNHKINNVNQSSSTKTSHDYDIICQIKNFQESKENKEQTKNIEKIDVAVQANTANFMFMAQFVADQLCLDINNEKHAFISDSENNKHDIMNKLKVHNVIYDNIHIIDKKSYNNLIQIKTLNEKLEKKILKMKTKNITFPTELKLLPIHPAKIQSLKLICPCAWKISDNKKDTPVTSIKEKRVVHLPVKQHLRNNKYTERTCKCCTGIEPRKGKKSKKKKKDQKSNVLIGSNDNESSTENKIKEIEDNKDDILENVEIDYSSEYSSPVISMSKRIKIVDIRTLISGEKESYNIDPIVDNDQINNFNTEIMPVNYAPSKSANSIYFHTEEICDTAVLENCPQSNYNLSELLSSSYIPNSNNHTNFTTKTLQDSRTENKIEEEAVSVSKLNDTDNVKPEISVVPVFIRQNEELDSGNETEKENMSFQSKAGKNEVDNVNKVSIVLSTKTDEDENNFENGNGITSLPGDCDDSHFVLKITKRTYKKKNFLSNRNKKMNDENVGSFSFTREDSSSADNKKNIAVESLNIDLNDVSVNDVTVTLPLKFN